MPASAPARLETHRSRIPWSWPACLALPWATLHYLEQTSAAPLTFTLRKFVDDPALLALFASLNTVFTFTVGATASYMSDRIWTRHGRRRPFLVLGWSGVAVALALIPFASNLATLVALILLLHLAQDIAKPYEPLYNEIVPPAQRGRAGIIRTLAVSLTGLVFNAVMLARFDHAYPVSSYTLTGETALYWLGALFAGAAALLVAFAIRETPPPSPTRERFHLRRFLHEVFGHPQWRRLYLLFACPFLAGMSLASFIPLFHTEQLGFTKAQVGYAGAIALTASLTCFVPLAGWLTDRVSRLRLFQLGLAGPALVNLTFFLLVRYRSHPAPLAFPTLLTFMILSAGFLAILYVVWGPLLYDYIPSDRFGTVSAGFAIVGGLTGFLLVNAAGSWIKLFTAFDARLPAGRFDYSSVFLFQLLGAATALAITVSFQRALARGEVVLYAKLKTQP